MKNKQYLNSRIGFIAVVILVLTLTILTIFSFFNQRNTEKLAATVNNLASDRHNIEKIDTAIQLLYVAENNSRMYAIYQDSSMLVNYVAQLNEVAAIIDTIGTSHDEDRDMQGQIKDKQLKTDLYIKAKLLLDSLLIKTRVAPVLKIENRDEPISRSEKTTRRADTTTKAKQIVVKNKKKLFGRLKDAILNKPLEHKDNQIVINQSVRDSIQSAQKAIYKRKLADLERQKASMEDLNKKEKDVLEANHTLFTNLQSLLQELKAQEVGYQNKRKDILTQNATSLTKYLKNGNYLVALFCLLLSVFILYILRLLFKNSEDLKVAKVKAEEFAKLKSEFVTTMSHEIRTPLHSLNAFANELVNKDEKLKSRYSQSEIIDAIKLSSGMLLGVVNNILDYTKIEKGKYALAKLPFNPKHILTEVLSGLQVYSKSKNLELICIFDNSTDCLVLGDGFQLRQILINLVGNAIKYTEKGKVQIDAVIKKINEQQIELHLDVTDTGIGMKSTDLDNIFKEFNQQNHTKEVAEGSAGLGLNIVKKIIELNKGEIKVKSVLAKGSSFQVRIPYKSYTEPVNNAKELNNKNSLSNEVLNAHENLPTDPYKKPLQILIVDNDKLNAKHLELTLLAKGHHCLMATDGDTAIQMYKNNQIDIVLTDISMPGISGFELKNKIIELAAKLNKKVKLIAVTGFEKEGAVKKISQNEPDFDGWLMKPFREEELLLLLHQLTSS